MKQMKKSIMGWKLLSILPLAGLLAVGMGLAGTAHAGPIVINPTLRPTQPAGRILAPDLQVRVWVDARSVRRNTNGTYNFTIRGQVKNIGAGNYVSRNNQQVLFLHEVGKSHHITNWHFSRLNRGQVMRVHVPVINHPGGEFVPAYELALSFDPDIYIDSNPANDDHNHRNNQATVSSRAISSAFARATTGPITVRPVGVRPGVRPGVLSGKKPDLVPVVLGSNPFIGIFKVKNQGGATAGASKLVVACKKISGHRGPGGGCPDSPALTGLFDDSLGGLVVSIPSLRAGQVYTARLSFGTLNWKEGKYKFTFNADATHVVAESNERNNVRRMIRRKIRRR